MPDQYSDVHAGAHTGATRGIQDVVLDRAVAEGLDLDPQQLGTIGLLARNAERHLSRQQGSPSGDHVYLWGPPGRGKTWILGAFFDALPTENKRRFHFHEFFRELHATAHKATATALAQIEEPEALGNDRRRMDRVVARTSAIEQSIESILGNVEVLCFDEFHCNDPGDAMLLARMFKFIMGRRILLVTTSNYPPEELLADEYYHHLILPTIAEIREHMDVHELDAHRDYRSIDVDDAQRHGYNTGCLLVAPAAADLHRIGLSAPAQHEAASLKPTSHDIRALRAVPGQLWFEFGDLCESLTSTLDYLELAKEFNHWVISDVPGAAAMTPFGLRRLANAIDVLYDHNIRLDLLAQDDFSESLSHLPELDAARLASRLNALQTTATRPITQGANA
ncbi:cell division protein ZapE [Paeniglutamicibacter psychrophenolicus]|uniref:cell division protein ZapE n=1 Tax=Paeniglutamicibacter psychrophenolicus TaxID=257454 RepID=UPI0027882A5B|nr:cell division protein ZapE [Paeniglutamicibacter psychrophenolicus]MDQ0093549.1 cell division protein ZapE [Paeniglutamicibacter psychrophenolicus]